MNEIAPGGDIRETPFGEALGERYLSYALSTIMARSLPDVRDGLKPVQRRLLFAMRQLRLEPGSGFKKCARVVGDVIGRYHPHGDTAVYDALVRLAQDFAARYPLVEGQGNFGNIDGDNAAAMRYTEARLTVAAEALLAGIDEDAVDFRTTYDAEDDEPVVLPAGLPNLLANGATGIAVGMATSIPPHNVTEICDALIHLIKRPQATYEKLVELIPGPDFPTGGILVESRENIVDAYRTGRGGFRVRARYAVEKLRHGLYQVAVSEIPYQIQKSRLVERIAELLLARKLPLLADIRDESDASVRIVLEPRNRSVAPDVLMEQLFRQTELEVRVGLNLNVLDHKRTPRVMNLREVLAAFLDHRHEVLLRRKRHRLERIERRLEVLAALMAVYASIDEVIRIIRDEDEPKAALMKTLRINDVQADAVLNMRLRQLRRLEEKKIADENRSLEDERTEITAILNSEKRRWKVIAGEIAETRARFSKSTEIGRRRTEIGLPPPAVNVPPDAMVEREPTTVVCSEKGWMRAVRGHVADAGELRYKEGDRAKFVIHAETTDKLIIFATNGRFYTLGCDKLPGGRGQGEPLRLMIELPNDHDPLAMFVYRPQGMLFAASGAGRGFVVAESDVVAQTRNGKQVLTLAAGEEAVCCAPVGEADDRVAVVGENRKLLIFALSEVPVMTRGRGVILQRYRAGGLSDATTFSSQTGLAWSAGASRTRTETDLGPWYGNRGQAGRMAPRGFAKSNRFT
jgi:topoisomerase-4 subunit A